MMTSSEVMRLRRQMKQRIREVVAERRISRQEHRFETEGVEPGGLAVESRSGAGERSLVNG